MARTSSHFRVLTRTGLGGLLGHSSAATIKLEGIEKPRNPLYLSLTH